MRTIVVAATLLAVVSITVAQAQGQMPQQASQQQTCEEQRNAAVAVAGHAKTSEGQCFVQLSAVLEELRACVGKKAKPDKEAAPSK